MTETWKIKNDNEAEWIIEQTNDDLLEIERFKYSLEEKIETLRIKLNKLNDEEDSIKERRDSYLLEYFETIPEELKKKTKTQEKYRLPSGEIVKKYPAPEVRRENNKLLAWIKENKMNDYVEVKEIPKWVELKKITQTVNGQVVTEDGEIVEGIEVIERPPVLEFKEV
ncbi:host-nuclease inhibitor Gam family protein [Tissierella creatinophila]|uniref:Bacteriophage Mu Gam like protein n=1 Tax=Tissierella creatinophila DSM 6911 TaxID=1123403 RepID=A0A1U7M4S0_TISCR|nr:host-nuclease inhibitor Gam family protein [Tissierella creatinophila]OLS02250.1 bacteriophage Mu Gam like protein [Tissierella creatinophila DSM 6911]